MYWYWYWCTGIGIGIVSYLDFLDQNKSIKFLFVTEKSALLDNSDSILKEKIMGKIARHI